MRTISNFSRGHKFLCLMADSLQVGISIHLISEIVWKTASKESVIIFISFYLSLLQIIVETR